MVAYLWSRTTRVASPTSQELSLSSNQISSIPDVLGQLTSLQVLNLGDNLLSSIPEAIGQLTGLLMLDLDGNPLEDELCDAYSLGFEVLLQYLRSIAPDPVRSQETKG